MSVKDRFSDFTNAGYFSRVDKSIVPEIHIGLDESGHKAIELRAKFDPRKVNGTTSIDVNQYRKDEYNTIRFSLLNNEISGLFYRFCDDIVEAASVITDDLESYTAVVNRFFQWKKLFVSSSGKYLSESEIMGLIGEITFMRNQLTERIGLVDALRRRRKIFPMMINGLKSRL